LALYDIVGTPGVAADISHCNAKGKVTGHKGAGELDAALQVHARAQLATCLSCIVLRVRVIADWRVSISFALHYRCF
jgi:hypothetical protein